MSTKRLIVVVGMHRSGTSAITRALQVMGVGLGDNLMPLLEGNNAKGFWEDLDLNALNIEMLSFLGKDWNSLSPASTAEIQQLQQTGYLIKATELLQSKLETADIFGFKDPRVAKLLPFWSEVFKQCNLDISYVLALRHPLSVALSLTKRDGFDPITGYTLWLGHVLEGLVNTQGSRRVLVDYDLLMANPDRELGRIASQLELVINQKELNLYKKEFLDESLRHSQCGVSDLTNDENCPELVKEVYTDLLEVASGCKELNSQEMATKSLLWSQAFNRQTTLLRLADNLKKTVSERDAQLAEREGQIASLNQTVADRDSQIAGLNQVVTDRVGQIASLNQTVAEREGQITALVNSRSWRLTAPLRTLRKRLSRSNYVPNVE